MKCFCSTDCRLGWKWIEERKQSGKLQPVAMGRRFFVLSFFYFTIRKHLQNYKKCLLFHRKISFRSRQIFDFFPFLSTFSRFRGLDGTRVIMTSWFVSHKLANVIFGITTNNNFWNHIVLNHQSCPGER